MGEDHQIEQDFYNHLVQLSDLELTRSEIEYHISNILDFFVRKMNLLAIQMKITSPLTNVPFSMNIAIGLAEEQCDYIATILQKDPETRFDFEYYKLQTNSQVDRSAMLRKVSNVTRMAKINYSGRFLTKFFLFADNEIEVSSEMNLLYNQVAVQCANTYYSKTTTGQELNRLEFRLHAVDDNPLPIIILDRAFRPIKFNSQTDKLLGDINQFEEDNLLNSKVLQLVTDEIEQISNLQLNESFKITRTTLNLTAYSSYRVDSVDVDLVISKFSSNSEIYFVMDLILLDVERTTQLRSILKDTNQSLQAELRSYAQFYNDNVQEAMEYGISTYFPAAFAMTINEESGPMVLTSSPMIDPDMVLEETIRLLAGLNTNHIMEQGYITGVSPWSNPIGELRWIGFYIPNEKARGDVEVHVIGLVNVSNLLITKAEMSNTLLGLLLGAMNQYVTTIKEDNADFITTPFYGNRHFSTLSIIQNILLELREGSAEVLAAYSSS